MINRSLSLLFLLSLTIFLSKPAFSQDSSSGNIFVKVKEQKPITDFLISKNVDAPPFSIFDGDKFPKYKDKAMLIYLWHIKCSECFDELAQLDELQRVLKPYNVEIISVSVGDAGQGELDDIYSEYKIDNLNKFSDSEFSIFKSLGAEKVPTSYIINKGKKLVAGVQGMYNWHALDVGIYLQLLGVN